MKKAILTAWVNVNTKKQGYTWTSPNEQSITKDFDGRMEALRNAPEGYVLLDDAYNDITENVKWMQENNL